MKYQRNIALDLSKRWYRFVFVDVTFVFRLVLSDDELDGAEVHPAVEA